MPGTSDPGRPAGAAGGDALLRRLARRHRAGIALSSAGSIGHQAFEALVPVVLGAAIDAAVATGDGGALVRWLLVLAATFVALNLAFRLQVMTGVRTAERAAHELRVRVAERVLEPSGVDATRGTLVGGEVDGSAGSLLNVAGDDAAQASLTLRGVVMLLGAASALVVATVVLLRISWPLGVLVLLGTPLLLFGIERLARPLQRRTAAEQARAAEASAVATDLVRGLRVLKGIGAEGAAAVRYRGTSERSLAARLRAAVAGNVLEGAAILLGGLLLAVVAVVAGRLALSRTISVGDLIAAAGVTQFLVGPLQRIGVAGRIVAEGRASADRVARVLAADPAVARAAGAADDGGGAPGTLALRGLRTATTPEEGALDLAVGPGELVGLVAADPADAAALLDVLARRRDPAAGVVELDGRELRGAAEAGRVPRLLVADHDADLFEGTLLENVTALLDGAGAAGDREERLAAAMAAADADEVVRALPDGVRSDVGERGSALSGGQRQRVALARALAADAPVLVLHEPTTAVDAVTEARIARGVRRVRGDRATLVACTSPTLLAACDRVRLLHGETVVDGTHGELVAREAAYREAVLG